MVRGALALPEKNRRSKMDLKIPYTNVTNKDEAFTAVKGAVTPELLAKWQVKADITYGDYVVNAKGKGFELNVLFKEDHCEINVNLAFLLKPLKGKILEGIQKQFTRVV